MGRPSSYKPEYCELLLDLYRQGGSVCDFCAEVGIGRQTYYDWEKANPEFAYTIKIGKELSEKWWTDQLKKYLVMEGGARFNTIGWLFTMKNRFGWRDKKEVEHDVAQKGKLIIDLSGDNETASRKQLGPVKDVKK